MVTNGVVENTGKLILIFPTGYDISSGVALNPTGRLWLASAMVTTPNQTLPSCALATVCGGGMLVMSGFEVIAPGPLSFEIKDVRSPPIGARSITLYTGDVRGFVIDTKTISVTPAMGTIQHVFGTPFVRVPNAGIEGDVDFFFATQGRVPPDGMIKITFPSTTEGGYPSPFVLGTVTMYKISGLIPSAGSINSAVVGQTVILTGFRLLEPGNIGFSLRGITSPGSSKSSSFIIKTTDANGLVYDQTTNVFVTPSINQLYSVDIKVPLSGERGPCNISFATQASIPGRGKLKIKFPSGIQLDKSMTATNIGGVLASGSPVLVVEVEPYTNTVIVNVHGSIKKGWLSFQLNQVTTDIGVGAGVFYLSTSDYGLPDRVFDEATHSLINPVDTQTWWDGDAVGAVVGPRSQGTWV